LKPSVCFLVDTREQQPLAFGPAVRTDYFSCATTRLAALREGDYGVALNGRPLLSIRLERKSLGDLHGRVGDIIGGVIRPYPFSPARFVRL
jgi:hypothetical protein